MLGLLVLAVAPSVALFLFFYARYRYRREPFRLLGLTFLFGALALLPSYLTSLSLEVLTGWRPDTPNLLHAALGALLIVGLVEESCKFVVVRLYAFPKREFDEPYDGIMYSVMAALGFATVENVLYVVTRGAGVGIMRAVLAVPCHAFDGVLMGYFLGLAKFARTSGRGYWLSALGLGLAALAHGVYDFLVFSLDKAPLLLGSLVVFAVLAWVIFFRATRQLSAQSPYRHADLTDQPDSRSEDQSPKP
jgi:RsiW-degrading membrane proteinase PrsW (M82 family)